MPPGFNNVLVVDEPANKQVVVRISTNTPKVLAWRGGQSSDWNHSDLNWLDTGTLTITKFTDGDRVIFDDTAAVPTGINVTEVINPGQVGTGILVSNSINAFTLNNSGGSIGNCSLVKTGSVSLTIDAATTLSAQVNSGKLAGSGSVSGTTIAAGAALDFTGTINGVLTVAGTGTLSPGGIAANTVTVQNGGVMTNKGSIQGGGLTLNSGSLFYNSSLGTLLSIGNANSVNVATNATLINEGNIGLDDGFHANSLTVNGTFKDLGVGNISLTTMTLNPGAVFLPGGNGIGTTSIKSALTGSGFPGRLTLLTGSTTLIKVDFANAQTNTIVKAQFTDFGDNSGVVTGVKSFTGANVVVTNINTGAGLFAAGQSFRMFQNSDVGILTGNIAGTGPSTNKYPIVTPTIPAVNTKWDLANLRDTDPNGFVNTSSFPTSGTNITISTFTDGGNKVTHLQWPNDYIGWRLQQQTNSLSVGLFTNWTTVTGSAATNDLYITNDAAIDTSFFRMIYP